MHKRSLKFSIFLSTALLMLASVAPAARAADASISMHGFISTTLFMQDQEFLYGNGQAAVLPITSDSNNSSGVDVRSTRVWWVLKGPDLGNGWKTSGRVEADFFGGFLNTGPYGSSQSIPRLRQANFTLTNPTGSSSVTIGQQWDLLFPIEAVPKSLTHIAFPLGFGTGMIGWRFPGVVWRNNLNDAQQGDGQWRLDLGAFTGQWNGPGSNTNFETAGHVDFRPQIQGRIHYKNGDLTAYGSLYFARQDLTGVSGTAPTPIKTTINSNVFTVGANWHPGSWSLLGAAYTGTGTGPVFGSMAQFGDISDNGVFVQGGYHFTPKWSGYLSYSQDKPDKADVTTWVGTGGRIKGQQTALNFIYGDGPYGFGVEFMHASLETVAAGGGTNTDDGNQFSVSAIFHF